jgi:MAF protein
MLNNLKKYNIILGSNSPRRRTLLAGLDVSFEVKAMPDIDESYPAEMPPQDVPLYIAENKAAAYDSLLKENDLLITADTVVILSSGEILGKPKDKEDATKMLKQLSGCEHRVITGVCIISKEKSTKFAVTSSVNFAKLTDDEIAYYLEKYSPYDKAGSYGIQEWIGYVGVECINGSFYNVMGLPVQRLYNELKTF